MLFDTIKFLSESASAKLTQSLPVNPLKSLLSLVMPAAYANNEGNVITDLILGTFFIAVGVFVFKVLSDNFKEDRLEKGRRLTKWDTFVHGYFFVVGVALIVGGFRALGQGAMKLGESIRIAPDSE